MKISRLLIWSCILLWNFSNCKINQRKELNMLEVKIPQINEVLKEIVKEESAYGDIENETIIIRIEKKKNSNEIRIGLLSKESMSSYLTGKQDKPFGFFEFKGVTVVAFGDEENMLFEKTKNKKDIPFLEVQPELKIKKGEIPPPPLVYEPIVWIYAYEKGELILTDKSRFTLLR